MASDVTHLELRIRYALLILVDEIFFCLTSNMSHVSCEHVELVKNLDNFFAYPWVTIVFNMIVKKIK